MLKDHPKGIMIMFTTEMWERFGFYIMMAILVLYMDNEFGWSDSIKGDHYGAFLGLVYFIPLLGGYLGDKIFGQINTVIAGSIAMFFGYVALALSSADQLVTFYVGLFLVAFGTGIFKVNMAVLVGNLYIDKIHLKDAGFNIFYMGVNVGATIAPLAATLLGYLFNDYRMSFWAAAIGMLICIVTFYSGKSKLMKADVKQSNKSEKEIVFQDISAKESTQRIIALGILFDGILSKWICSNSFC